MVAFDRFHGLDGRLDIVPLPGPGLPRFGNDRDIPPLVQSGGVHEQELVDALRG
ncbi:hypothetical protein [Methylobacterium sp. CB376]|uniref:hypothetical protein n=1 Tax=Methylobacterium sp. CB376 TaxID=3138063 RepID=UPI003133B4B0